MKDLNNKNYLDTSDINEQFMRSLVILDLCKKYVEQKTEAEKEQERTAEADEIKIGELAQTELRKTLESISNSDLITKLQTIEGTKEHFDYLGNLALLVKDRSDNFARRYYSKPLVIGKEVYYMCNNWKIEDIDNINNFIKQGGNCVTMGTEESVTQK